MSVFIDVVVPTFAVFFALAMWISPFQAVLECRKRGSLGDMNPLPFCAMMFNCTGWSMYGFIKHDPFITCSNITGIILGMFYICSTLQILNKEIGRSEYRLLTMDAQKVEGSLGASSDSVELEVVKNRIQPTSDMNNKQEDDVTPKKVPGRQENETLMKLEKQSDNVVIGAVVTPIVWFTVGTIAWCALEGDSSGEMVLGIVCFIGAFCYFGSPLSTMLEVIAEKDSSSIYPPMIIANAVNCTLWVLYGLLAINDVILWSINAIGFLLAFMNAVLLVIYPRTRAGGFCAAEKDDSTSVAL